MEQCVLGGGGVRPGSTPMVFIWARSVPRPANPNTQQGRQRGLPLARRPGPSWHREHSGDVPVLIASSREEETDGCTRH